MTRQSGFLVIRATDGLLIVMLAGSVLSIVLPDTTLKALLESLSPDVCGRCLTDYRSHGLNDLACGDDCVRVPRAPIRVCDAGAV
jgi:hypothetical protein